MNEWTEEKISWFQACPRRSGFQGFQKDTVIKEEYLLLVDKVTLTEQFFIVTLIQ